LFWQSAIAKTRQTQQDKPGNRENTKHATLQKSKSESKRSWPRQFLSEYGAFLFTGILRLCDHTLMACSEVPERELASGIVYWTALFAVWFCIVDRVKIRMHGFESLFKCQPCLQSILFRPKL
jgi:hypothetical protein